MTVSLSPSHSQSYVSLAGLSEFGVERFKRQKHFFNSQFIAALLIVFLADFVFRLTFHPNVFDLPNHNSIWWTVQDFRQLKQVPNIVLFGSSLLGAAVVGGDATFLNQAVDCATWHRSAYLEYLLGHHKQGQIEDYFGANIRTFSWAIGGQMPSDVYAIYRVFLKNDFKPQCVVWGIAPRDFVDAAFYDPSTSDTVLYMNQIAKTQIVKNEHLSLPCVVTGAADTVSSICKWRHFIASEFSNGLKSILVWAEKNGGLPLPTTDLARKLEVFAVDVSDKGERLALPYTGSTHAFTDNTAEYQMRYNPFKPRTFKSQMLFFDRILTELDASKVKLLLVNMPLTKQNLQLMPDGMYSVYLDKIRQMAKLHNAIFCDFNTESFTKQDFSDTAHLNGLGGKKFIKKLSNFMCLDQSQLFAADISLPK